MKTPKEQAEELVDAHRTYIRQADKYTTLLSSDEVYLALKCAIKAVEHTIEVLDSLHDDMSENLGVIANKIDEQNQILTELKAKL